MNAICRTIVIGLLVYPATLSVAQNREAEREQFQARGTLRGVAPGGLQMATDDNQLVAVKIQGRQAEVSFTGNADASFLKPGMQVKFSALVKKSGKVAEPITSLVIFTPQDRTEIGVYSENAASAPNPLEGLFSTEPKEEPKKPARPRRIVEDQPYRIGGTLVSLKAGKMVVSAGGNQIKCELADDAKIRVATSNLAYARVGDKVDVDGWTYATMKQLAVANRVSVTAAEPLTGEDKKKTRASADEENERQDSEKPDKKDE
jgi:hypothetical protein